MNGSLQLTIAAALSFTAALLHVAIVVGGPAWYRFFGAGEGMATLAATGSIRPALITLAIAAVLFVWGLYALSGAGLIARLPLLRVALALITVIYLARGAAGLVLPFVSKHPLVTQNSTGFWLVSSLVCCVFGVAHLLGTINRWEYLAVDGTPS